ncbi:type II secretion system F family protein [Mycetocola reblochoni]|uniref:type II secretion system F family protein n=1 Tax=Mycetocola reblochoni TaxID=331618 RepID=UPI0015C60A83|nr:type II secretion system F family protein [Mycetocola reblochoni]
MTSIEWGAIGWGIVLGLGAWMIVGAVPRLSRPRLVERIAPHLQDVSAGARAIVRRRAAEPSGALRELLRPLFDLAVVIVSRLGATEQRIERRLRIAGVTETVDQYRRRVAAVALAGVGVGLLLAAVLWALGRTGLESLLPATVVLVALIMPEVRLRARSRRRRRMIEQELPVVLELMSLALTAGESVRNAVSRLAGQSNGVVGEALRAAVARTAAGIPLSTALTTSASAVDSAEYARVVDQLVLTLDRGAPVAEVLRAQAGDARQSEKRRLVEEAGRREVVMMVPLVFVILPLSVAFAVFPGIFVIDAGLP